MAAQFPWDELLDLIINDQRTAPIVGPELSTLPAQGGLTFEQFAIQKIASEHSLSSEVQTFSQLAALFRQQHRPEADLTRELTLLLRPLLAGATASTLPEPLRLIADVRDFPLILTTAPDGLLAAAIRLARERDAGPLVASLGSATDLPRNWLQGPRPTLFHLFGRINPVPDFALTDEDVLEFLHRLQNDTYRPGQLCDELRSRHLILIGLGLSDWALRLLLRTLHGARLSDDNGQSIFLAGDTLARDHSLIGFLRDTGRRVHIFQEGSAADFVRELHKRWHSSQDEGWSTTADGKAIPAEPAEMIPGAVYVSAARSDRTAAERLAALLDEAGLDVWFDRNDLPGGHRYERRIRQHLHQCDLFIPLLSTATDAQPDAFFRREWHWALERHDSVATSGHFLQPVWVGDGVPPAAPPAPFAQLPLPSAPAGQPAPELVHRWVDAVRQARALRTP